AVIAGNIHYQDFIRLVFFAVDLFYQHLRLSYRQLEAFAAHGLDEDAQVKDTAAVYEEAVGAVRVFHAEGQVLLRLLYQPVAQVTGGDEFSILAEEGRV